MITQLKAILGTNQHVKDVMRGSSYTFLAKIISTVMGLISSLIIARYYGAQVVGIIALINSILMVFTIFGLMGTNVALLRLIPEYLERYSLSHAYNIYKKALVLVLILSFSCGVILYNSASFIAINIFDKEWMLHFLLIASPFVIIRSIIILNNDTLRGLQKMKLYSLTQILPSLITVFFLSILTIYFYDKYNPVYIMFGTDVITIIILSFIIYKLFSIKNVKNSEMSILKLLNLSFPMFLTASMQIVITQTDMIMLGTMRSTNEVGVYAIVMKLSLLTSFILSSVNAITAPKFAQLYHTNKISDLKIVAKKSTQLIFWGTVPLILIYIIAGYYILLIFGNEFKSGYFALILLAIGQLINSTVGSVGYFLNMTGHQNIFKNIMIFSVVLNLLLNLYFIPLYGINGAAVASMISMIVWNSLAAFYVKKIFGFSISYFPFFLKQNLKGT